MGMPADEQRWWIVNDAGFQAFVVMPGVTPNVGHPNFYPFATKFEVRGKGPSQQIVVNVAPNTA